MAARENGPVQIGTSCPRGTRVLRARDSGIRAEIMGRWTSTTPTWPQSGGGTLRGPAAPSTSKLAGTFTQTQIQHPDTIWSPRGSELAPPDRPLTTSRDAYQEAESERPVEREHAGADGPLSFHSVAGNVRAAVRPMG